MSLGLLCLLVCFCLLSFSHSLPQAPDGFWTRIAFCSFSHLLPSSGLCSLPEMRAKEDKQRCGKALFPSPEGTEPSSEEVMGGWRGARCLQMRGRVTFDVLFASITLALHETSRSCEASGLGWVIACAWPAREGESLLAELQRPNPPANLTACVQPAGAPRGSTGPGPALNLALPDAPSRLQVRLQALTWGPRSGMSLEDGVAMPWRTAVPVLVSSWGSPDGHVS